MAQSGAPLWYFAYGSNLDPATFEGRRRMRPSAAHPVRLDGFALVFDLPVGEGRRAVANLKRQAGESVHGVAYRIRAEDAERLDQSEGVHRGYYARTAVRVMAAGGQQLDAFTYLSCHGQPGRRPSVRYLWLILQGARHHGLPEAWLRRLEIHPLAPDERPPAPPRRG
jgi:cation transport regulator ChaC